MSGQMTLRELLAEWLPVKKQSLNKTNVGNLTRDAKYLKEDIGEMFLSDMTSDFIEKYFEELDKRTHEAGYAIAKMEIRAILLRNGYTRKVLRQDMGIRSSALSYVYNRSKLTVKWASRFAERLNIPYEEMFDDFSAQEPYASDTNQRTKSALRQALSYAKARGYIGENYAGRKFVKGSPIEHAQAKIPTHEEAKTFLHTALNYPDLRVRTAMFLLLIFRFQRREVNKLNWKCFNFADNTISTETKRIHVPCKIMEIFQDYRVWQEQNGNAHNDYIFRKTDGTPIHEDTIKGWFRKVLARAQLQNYTLTGFQNLDFDYTDAVTEIPKIQTVGRQHYYMDPERREMRELGFRTVNEYREYQKFLLILEKRTKRQKGEKSSQSEMN